MDSVSYFAVLMKYAPQTLPPLSKSECSVYFAWIILWSHPFLKNKKYIERITLHTFLLSPKWEMNITEF